MFEKKNISVIKITGSSHTDRERKVDLNTVDQEWECEGAVVVWYNCQTQPNVDMKCNVCAAQSTSHPVRGN